jgi:hypothetical protein
MRDCGKMYALLIREFVSGSLSPYYGLDPLEVWSLFVALGRWGRLKVYVKAILGYSPVYGQPWLHPRTYII